MSKERYRSVRDEGPSDEDLDAARTTTDQLPGSGMGSAAANALGAAMLGLDMALRNEPPAQVVAAEHVPERGVSGDDDLVVVLPDPAVGPSSPSPEPDDG